MSITTTLFPPSYREAALVAFLRTFWQVIRPPIVLGSLGLATIETTGIVHLRLQTVGIIALAALLSAVVSGLLAAGDILKNGLPDAYATAAAAASAPIAVESDPQPTAPTSASAPAAGVPPAAAPTLAPITVPLIPQLGVGGIVPSADAAPYVAPPVAVDPAIATAPAAPVTVTG